MRSHTPDWVSGLHTDLGERWPEAMTLLIHVLAARFAWGLQDREVILKASAWLADRIAEEALVQIGEGKEAHFDA